MLKHILEQFNDATAINAIHAISDDVEVTRIARVAQVQVATPDKTDSIASDEIISNWWLMHFVDRDSIEVAIWPPCNYASGIQSYPNSIAAEPLPSPITVEATVYD